PCPTARRPRRRTCCASPTRPCTRRNGPAAGARRWPTRRSWRRPTGRAAWALTAERLTPWPPPERGMLPPGAFLPIAEQGDLLRDLDRWVLQTALREAARWPV